MKSLLSSTSVPFDEHARSRFAWLDVDGDGYISRFDVAQRMQDREVRGADSALLATLRRAVGEKSRGKGITAEMLRDRLPELEQSYSAALEHLAAPALNRSLQRSDDPQQWWRDIHQGPLNDCWFVAAVIALLRFRPGDLRDLIADRGDGRYDVHFPGRKPVRGVFITDAEIASYRPAHFPEDGLLLPVLEKAYGLLLNSRTREPFEEINTGTIRAGKGIRLLTGHRSHTRYLTRGPFDWWRQQLQRLVEAAATAAPPRIMIVSDTNFRTGHLHAVVGYDPLAATITLHDPAYAETRSPLPMERWVKDFTFLFMEGVN